MKFTVDYFSEHIDTLHQYLGHLNHSRHVSVLEIGSLEGRSSVWFLLNICTHPTSQLTCVDTWDNPSGQLGDKTHEGLFDANMREAEASVDGYNRVVKMKCRSFQALQILHQRAAQFDAVYIDGCHEGKNVMEDAVLSFNLLTNGGIMVFDDFKRAARHARVQASVAIDAFMRVYQPWVDVLHLGALAIIRRREDVR